MAESRIPVHHQSYPGKMRKLQKLSLCILLHQQSYPYRGGSAPPYVPEKGSKRSHSPAVFLQVGGP